MPAADPFDSQQWDREHLLTALHWMIAAQLIVGKRHARQLPQPTTNTDPDQ
ncbi:hypothetical protein [Mycobacterium marinum]|uniref:hypothetical protein n=1 Tax=Mycobacterium marinum TaxID=1781 RepID=UPI002358FF54|nr:hypothetical protein [Mycobacterium marinum]MDC8972404.1 hypothetical protein [Mycobacterium marinum]